MQCKQCGTLLEKGDNHCPQCGKAQKMTPRETKHLVYGILAAVMILGMQICMFFPWLTINGDAVSPFGVSGANAVGETTKLILTVFTFVMQGALVLMILFGAFCIFAKDSRLTLLARFPGMLFLSLCLGVGLYAVLVGLLEQTTVLSFFELQISMSIHAAMYVVLVFAIALQVLISLWKDTLEP